MIILKLLTRHNVFDTQLPISLKNVFAYYYFIKTYKKVKVVNMVTIKMNKIVLKACQISKLT